MPSFVDNWKLLDATQEVNRFPVFNNVRGVIAVIIFCTFLAGTQGVCDYCTSLALMVSRISFHKQKQDPCLINYS